MRGSLWYPNQHLQQLPPLGQGTVGVSRSGPGHGEKGQIPLLPAATSGFSPRWERLASVETSPEPASS